MYFKSSFTKLNFGKCILIGSRKAEKKFFALFFLSKATLLLNNANNYRDWFDFKTKKTFLIQFIDVIAKARKIDNLYNKLFDKIQCIYKVNFPFKRQIHSNHILNLICCEKFHWKSIKSAQKLYFLLFLVPFCKLKRLTSIWTIFSPAAVYSLFLFQVCKHANIL